MTTPINTAPATIPLPPHFLACEGCGVGVEPHDERETVLVTCYGREGTYVSQATRITEIGIAMTRCASCAAIREDADQLLAEHPRVEALIGSHSVAMHRVEGALSGLAALGQDFPTTYEDNEIRLLVEHLAVPGIMAQWIRRFVPKMDLDADPDSCAAEPWAHLVRAPGTSEALRDGYARFIQAVTERPEPISPPSPFRACLMCGVPSVVALPSRAYYVWTRRTVDATGLGGRPSPDAIKGVTCPPCEDAIQETGGTGASALEWALLRHLGAGLRTMVGSRLGVVQGWGVLAGAKPNETAWAHLSNLDELRDSVQRWG